MRRRRGELKKTAARAGAGGGAEGERASRHRRDDSKVISPEVTSPDERTFYRGANEAQSAQTLPRSVSRCNTQTDRGMSPGGNRERKEKDGGGGGKEKGHPRIPSQINPLFTTEIYESHSAASCPLPPPPPPSFSHSFATYTPGLDSIFPSLAAYKGRNCDHLSPTPGREDEFGR